MNKFRKLFLLLKSKSIRYTIYRLTYEIERRSGLLSRKFPTSPPKIGLPSLAEWRSKEAVYLFDDRNSINIKREKESKLKNNFECVLDGKVQFFSSQWYDLGHDYDWVTNLSNGYRYDFSKHWTSIESLSKEAGDIKFLWEPSRFSWLYTIVRYDYHYNEDHFDFLLSKILDWINKNPLNCGPNYKCSQEISVRVLNWLFALNFYKNSKLLTEEKWQVIINSIYWQIDHVYNNINFSRIAVRNNHAITETLTLYLIGLMFPEFKEASKWKKKGKRWFEQEVDYQIDGDGAYIQNSMNYHRVVIQLLSLGIALADKNDEKFCDEVYRKAYKSVNFLYQFQNLKNGFMPNYGANDGALFFQFNDCSYVDYKPQLDALHILLTGRKLYGEVYEDSNWLCATPKRSMFKPITQQLGQISFNESGYHLIRDGESLTFLRAGSFKGRFAQADQLHIDIWYGSENILFDGGSYMYNTDSNTIKYFSGTESHNTVMLDSYDQMLKGPRFIWFYVPRILETKIKETEDEYILIASIVCFKHLKKGIIHKRVVRKQKGYEHWIVEDFITGKPSHIKLRQIWHTKNSNVEFISNKGEKIEKTAYQSLYYGIIEECKQIEFITNDSAIQTHIFIK